MSAVLPLPTAAPTTTAHAPPRAWSASKATVYNDKVVRQFAVMAVVWGVVSMLVGVAVGRGSAALIWLILFFRASFFPGLP